MGNRSSSSNDVTVDSNSSIQEQQKMENHNNDSNLIVINPNLPAPDFEKIKSEKEKRCEGIKSKIFKTDIDLLENELKQAGVPTEPRGWNEKDSPSRKKLTESCIPYFANKLGRMPNSKPIPAETITYEEFPLQTENDFVHHMGYLKYVQFAFHNHIGIEVGPHHFWSVIGYYISKEITENPEKYRELFTSSAEQVQIELMPSDKLNLNELREKVIAKIPSDIYKFLDPKFSFPDPAFEMFKAALFGEIVHKYYSYMIMCCGIPIIGLIGTDADWDELISNLDELHKRLDFDYIKSASNYMREWKKNRHDVAWLKKFIDNERCGSGSQNQYIGHILNLIPGEKSDQIDMPEIKCKVGFKFEDSDTKYTLHAGLYRSELITDDDSSIPILIPKYCIFASQFDKTLPPNPDLPINDEILAEIFDCMRQVKLYMMNDQDLPSEYFYNATQYKNQFLIESDFVYDKEKEKNKPRLNYDELKKKKLALKEFIMKINPNVLEYNLYNKYSGGGFLMHDCDADYFATLSLLID